jgi:hypothetical protein
MKSRNFTGITQKFSDPGRRRTAGERRANGGRMAD